MEYEITNIYTSNQKEIVHIIKKNILLLSL